MKIDFSRILTNFDGKPILTPEKGEPVDLKTASMTALLGQYQDERNLSGEEKFKRYELAKKIHQSGEIELKSEEIALIKSLVAKAYAPLAVGKLWEMLENAN